LIQHHADLDVIDKRGFTPIFQPSTGSSWNCWRPGTASSDEQKRKRRKYTFMSYEGDEAVSRNSAKYQENLEQLLQVCPFLKLGDWANRLRPWWVTDDSGVLNDVSFIDVERVEFPELR